MNVTLPEKEKGLKRRVMLYTAILTVCVIAIGIAIYQFFADEKLEVILGLSESEDEEIDELKAGFNQLFTNELLVIDNSLIPQKANNEKEIVYTTYIREEESVNDYNLDVKIPYININSELAKKYNEEINKNFEIIVEKILQTSNRNFIYSVDYMATIENNILTVAILSNYKEGNSAQRTLVKTYNYNLKNDSKVTIDDLMSIANVNDDILNNRIKREIERSQEQSEELRKLGYNIYSRDSKSEKYKKENIEEFFMYNGKIYIIYAYGNTNSTSEMDIVII